MRDRHGDPEDRGRRRFTTAGILLGLGLGGFVDGIVFHQILQWHHMGTASGRHDSFPRTTVPSLEQNTLWDGLFHAATWVLVAAGLFLLWRAAMEGHRASNRALAGLLLAGWGIFDVVEGTINHLLLGIHHVRDDRGGPVSWDVGFIAFGALLVLVGVALRRQADGGPATTGAAARG